MNSAPTTKSKPLRPRRYALSFCEELPLGPKESKVLQRRLPTEAAGLPLQAIALLADGDDGCLPIALRADGKEVDVWSKSFGSRWYAEGPGFITLAVGAQISLEVRNNGTTPAHFRGALLLGEWSQESNASCRLLDATPSSCRDGSPCTVPQSGGACPGCNYPRAYAHPDSLLDAFEVDALYIRGTAMTVFPDYGVLPGVVQIIQHDGSQAQHKIPSTSTEGRMLDAVAMDTRLANVSPAQLCRESTSALAALGSGAAADLLEAGARLLRMAELDSSRRDLARALIEGVSGLITSRPSISARNELRHHLEKASYLSLRHDPTLDNEEARVIRPVVGAIRTLLQEIDRGDRSQAVARAPRDLLLVDDRRPRVNWLCEGPFPGAVSRIRIALLPEEANHVRIYDLRVGTRDAHPIGVSVLDRVPVYRPDTVREDGPPVDLGSHVTRRYLPGATLAGRLRDGACWNPDDPYALRSDDLLGGVRIELPTLPPLSYAYLVYEVDPGHALVAVIRPE